MLVSFATLDGHAELHTPTPIRAIWKRCATVSFALVETNIIIPVNVDKGRIMAQFVVHRSTPANTSIAVMFRWG